MKRALILVLALAACSPKLEAPEDPAASAPPPVTDTWLGRYAGDLMVRIDATHRVVLIEGEADGCTGDIGLADGGLPSKAISASELEVALPPDDGAACTFRIRKNGDVLTVTQSEACSVYHGATCSFNGTAKRVK
ncbi:hypothetical protein [Asticcacaulis sp. AC402]|uniref:hypothetical protein n=1 Tax=Asticcacaulis sp. AC402 TaxID=1282361 RepID=UPI0003C3CA16|nr:hypothetical protein [Asticcacaulis sp. AC402]ESQ74826.1 hypothetical protein ABAC402_11785 [Asticcacaulis sp. AC402]